MPEANANVGLSRETVLNSLSETGALLLLDCTATGGDSFSVEIPGAGEPRCGDEEDLVGVTEGGGVHLGNILIRAHSIPCISLFFSRGGLKEKELLKSSSKDSPAPGDVVSKFALNCCTDLLESSIALYSRHVTS